MENQIEKRKKQQEELKEKLQIIEGFFRPSKSDEDCGGLMYTIVKNKVRSQMGLTDLAEKPEPLTEMYKVCKEWVDKNGDNAEWLLRKNGMGLPLLRDEKVELAKYHIAITHLCLISY